MGLPGLRGPPGTKVREIFTLWKQSGRFKANLNILCLSFQGLPGYKGDKVSLEADVLPAKP